MLSFALLARAFIVSLSLQQTFSRPLVQRSPTEANGHSNSTKGPLSKVQAGYYPNWAIYDENFQPTDIVPRTLTHILYAFADVSNKTGVISLSDSYADEQKLFPGDPSHPNKNDLYGNLKQLYLLKMENRNLKVSLSVGGASYSTDGHFNFLTNPSARASFVSSAVQLIEDYGLDGIDLDYEFPSNAAEGQAFADLITSLRTAFDQLAERKGDTEPYQISAAVSAGSDNYSHLKVKQMDAALNYWNLMAYDYAGDWSSEADDQANLYGGERTGVNTDDAIKWYVKNGATPSKIVMGIPLYGRAFENTAGLGKPYKGVNSASEDDGIYNYNVLPLPGAQVHEDTSDVASYSYDPSKRELVSYDTPNIVVLKAQYVDSNSLAGSMFWDISTDKVGSQSLVNVSATIYGSLEHSLNHVSYPDSKWANIRDNMGKTPVPASSLDAVSSGHCSMEAWNSTMVYTGGDNAAYNNHVWAAKWWTIGDVPGGSVGVWKSESAC